MSGETQLPIIEERKLFKIGNSLAITIPHEWIEARGLKEGDELAIFGDGDLVIKVKTQEVVDEAHRRMEG